MELRKITRKELLKRYAAGDRDFSGVDLSGMMIVNHFRYIDLSGTDGVTAICNIFVAVSPDKFLSH